MHSAIHSTRLRRSVGVLLVLGYLLSVPGVSPFALSLLARAGVGPGHAVQFEVVGDHFDLVLHHGHDEQTCVANPQEASSVPQGSVHQMHDHHADHVIEFESHPSLLSKCFASHLLLAAVSWITLPLPAVWEPMTGANVRTERGPPAIPLVARLRTTVLLV